MKLNNKGFTLVEVLAVVVILGVIGGIATSSVISSINSSKEASYKIMVNNIVIASENLYKEVEFDNTLYKYEQRGKTNNKITIDTATNSINTNLQTLVSNGFLTGNENTEQTGSNKNKRCIKNPKTKEDIGTCNITIQKGNKKYIITQKTTNPNCPTDTDYDNYKKGVK